ncbi:hypothetical protein ACHAXA_002850 [Cyclostephanos tholiformis]|uniref:Uncharacterized protein n=1 Tax=Cyclostephanos tholiformis TaxID=382380 RepID=A0ABD3RBZ3_9STRA
MANRRDRISSSRDDETNIGDDVNASDGLVMITINVPNDDGSFHPRTMTTTQHSNDMRGGGGAGGDRDIRSPIRASFVRPTERERHRGRNRRVEKGVCDSVLTK